MFSTGSSIDAKPRFVAHPQPSKTFYGVEPIHEDDDSHNLG